MNAMRNKRHQESEKSEKGVALLIAIFALMLISAVAISLVLMSGTGSAIDSNYRNSTKAFYSAYAGLEEGRGRLAPSHPNSILAGLPSPLPVSPTIEVQYITNPAAGEVVTPTNLAANNPYADNEFFNEWGVPVTAANVVVLPTIASVSTVAGLSGPLYKWVRITGLTEASAKTDVDGNGALDPVGYAIFNISGHQYLNTPANAGLGGNQVYRITALAVLPDNSRRMLQYDVVMNTLNMNFPSPLTLPGQNVTFKGANSNQWFANGQDGSGAGNNSSYVAVPGCTPNPATSLPAIGVTDPSGSTTNLQTVQSPTGMPRPSHYTGGGMNSSSAADVTLSSALQTPQSLNQLVQTITQNADLVYTPPPGQPATPSNLPSAMSATNPQTVVINGDFSMSGNFTGYGLLVVTGNFAYSGTTGWDGVILVIGDGTTTFLGNGGGNAGFNGSIFVATTKDTSGNLLPSLGNVSFDINGGGGSGVYYDSCWINNSQNNFKKFAVLSFREILNF